MARTPTGTTAEIAKEFSPSVAFSGATNTTEAALTFATPAPDLSAYQSGDFVEITSGWAKISNRIYKILTQDLTDGVGIILVGCDTTNTELFPQGQGKGSIRKITKWEAISQKLAIQSTGGDPKVVTFAYVETGEEQNIFDGHSATTYSIDLDAESVNKPYYETIKSISNAQTVSALKMNIPGGARVLLSCTVSLNENPTMAPNAVMMNKVTLYGRGRTVRYPAPT
jgi:hypothetical protein